ncbi:cellulose-binding protein [Actinoplanes sp. ATCC 53533]|uniref:cellulose binding domain-containing protein n=1 Tax=Actinoplanes sp. ATCC 53533 TaxID=1288362 RepID=UPI000F7A580B|nr:cellulose binding domain-containing protein [Actinoplanes sp. ATCC 53533]RSM46143.1 cellulose-binding protein [Actinoplanes sp. ATCC 53533]
MSRRRFAGGAAVLALVLGAATLTGVVGGTASAAEFGAAEATAGCGRAPTLTSGTRTIQSGGQNRTYILRVPDGYDRNRPYKLIFAFHWLNGTASNVASGGSAGAVWAYYGQQQLSNNTAILVAPQGIDNGWANTGGRDLTLVDDLTRLIEGDLCVDTSQLFALGWSYGGAMSYAVACARPTIFRAVAVISGANLSGCSGGTQPVAYLGIHGTHDSVLNISLGRSLRDTFVRNNGCTAQNPPEPGQGSLTHIVTAYAGCRAGYPVKWAAFDGDHTPEPVDGSTSTSGARTWTGGEIWRFFSQLPSTTPTTPTTGPTTGPTTTPPTGQPAACAAGYRIVSQWQGGFQGEVTVTAGSTAVTGWRISWAFANGQTITQIWGGRNTPSGGTQNVTNETWNGSLGAGASTVFGFTATWNGTNSVPTLTCTPV